MLYACQDAGDLPEDAPQGSFMPKQAKTCAAGILDRCLN